MQQVSHIGSNNQGRIYVTNFDQLVDTAEKRMFGLRKKFSLMYDDVPEMKLYKQEESRFK